MCEVAQDRGVDGCGDDGSNDTVGFFVEESVAFLGGDGDVFWSGVCWPVLGYNVVECEGRVFCDRPGWICFDVRLRL